MFVEKLGGVNGEAHSELWGLRTEMSTLLVDKKDYLLGALEFGDVLFFSKDEATVYYLYDTVSTVGDDTTHSLSWKELGE